MNDKEKAEARAPLIPGTWTVALVKGDTISKDLIQLEFFLPHPTERAITYGLYFLSFEDALSLAQGIVRVHSYEQATAARSAKRAENENLHRHRSQRARSRAPGRDRSIK